MEPWRCLQSNFTPIALHQGQYELCAMRQTVMVNVHLSASSAYCPSPVGSLSPSVSVSPPFALAKCTWTGRPTRFPGQKVKIGTCCRRRHRQSWMAKIAVGALSLTVLFSLLPSEARIPLLPDKRHKPPSVRCVPIWYSFSAAPFSLPLFLPLSSHPSPSLATTNLFYLWPLILVAQRQGRKWLFG